MKKYIAFLIALLIMFPLLWAYAADVPFLMNYQGSVKTLGGTPYNGNGYFKFAIVNPAGDTAYWSNDGSTTDGTEPNVGSTGVPVTVSNGLFSVRLGDTAFTNMSSMSAAVFDNTSTYVRTWFSDDDASFTQLSPDQRIASGAYAIKAQDVENSSGAATTGYQTSITTDNTSKIAVQKSITIPAPGIVVALGNGYVYHGHTNGTVDDTYIKLDNVSGTASSSVVVGVANVRTPSAAPTGNYWAIGYSMTRTFVEATSGTKTYYINCIQNSGTSGWCYSNHLTLLYFPNTY